MKEIDFLDISDKIKTLKWVIHMGIKATILKLRMVKIGHYSKGVIYYVRHIYMHVQRY